MFVENWSIFFFQAEDGIRGLYVTGVQTCALPICGDRRTARGDARRRHGLRRRQAGGGDLLDLPRSEEHTSELQSRRELVCRLLLEKKKKLLLLGTMGVLHSRRYACSRLLLSMSYP